MTTSSNPVAPAGSILAAYVPGAPGGAVLEFSYQEAIETERQLVVVNVRLGKSLIEKHVADETDARAALKRIAGGAVDFSFVPLDAPSGDEVHALVEYAEHLAPRMTVIGLRSRSAVGKFIFGSTAQQLLVRMPCPVVAVKVAGDA